MLKKLSKQKISDIITYGIVLVAFIVMQILINAGQISSLFEGLMVPLCTYIILAISLNLVVGVLVTPALCVSVLLRVHSFQNVCRIRSQIQLCVF